MDDLSGARRRFLLGVGALALAVLPTFRKQPYDFEVAAFDAVNGLPDSLSAPLWPLMQVGALAAVPAAAGLAHVTGRTSLASRLLVTGTSTWVLAKGVKRMVGRGRPADVLASARVRGRAATGTGFLSGHAGISAALASGVAHHDPDLLPGVVGVAATVAFARIYVGAHLPLDVVGGAGLGLAVNAAYDLWEIRHGGARPRRAWGPVHHS